MRRWSPLFLIAALVVAAAAFWFFAKHRPNAVTTGAGIPAVSEPTIAGDTTVPPAASLEIAEGPATARAIAAYPELAEPSSALKTAFVARHALYRKQRPAFFEQPDWPTALARECARGLPATPAPSAPTRVSAGAAGAKGVDEYGDRPDTKGNLLPSAAKRAIKESLKDPESFQLRAVGVPTRASHQGEKCWQFDVVFAAKNGVDGDGVQEARCYMRGSTFIGLESIK
jgi:hypothetical protein